MKIYTILFLFLAVPQTLLAQDNFSVSVNTGLVLAKEDLGKSVGGRFGVDFNRFGLEASYQYAELDSSINNYIISKYALTAGYNVYSQDKSFLMTLKTGPALLYFNGFEESNCSNLGLDISLALSYNLFDSLDLEMGLTNNLNKKTNSFLQTFFGFKYNFRKKN
ncbi:hypothetical protein [Flavobacterium sp.]|uniref:hypothetical protein n=1 Tax=Flavobacterium sp. TaxID=239 RepID=UPI003A8F96F8